MRTLSVGYFRPGRSFVGKAPGERRGSVGHETGHQYLRPSLMRTLIFVPQDKALAQFAYIGDGFGGGLFPSARGWLLLGEGFEGAGDDLLGRLVAAGAKMLGDELFAVRIEG